MRLYYAQNKEDLLIRSFFPDVKVGFYIDVGANDPVIDSVTKLFYDEGWSGINVEPIQKHFEALKELRPRDINLQIGLGDRQGKLTFTEYPEGDGLSTFDSSMQEFYAAGGHPFPTAKQKKYQTEVRTLSQVIAETKPDHIHFIKIDVEGYEYEVVKGYDWKKLRPELICIEANHIFDDWRPILKKNKYHKVYFDGINNYYLAEESLRRREFFNYPDAAFSGNPIYFPAFKEIKLQIERPLEELRGLLVDREAQIVVLQEREHDVRFLARQLYKEGRTRIDMRGRLGSVGPGLAYKRDSRLRGVMGSAEVSKDEAIQLIHRLDAQNIVYKGRNARVVIRSYFWRVVGGTLTAGAVIARKLL